MLCDRFDWARAGLPVNLLVGSGGLLSVRSIISWRRADTISNYGIGAWVVWKPRESF